MATPTITSVTPPAAVPGGRIAIYGSGFTTAASTPRLHIGDETARLVFASSTELGAIVPPSAGGPKVIRVEGCTEPATVAVGVPIATGLHQVDNPVFDQHGNLYVTYSGTRGQQVPVSIFRVTPGGTRESFSSSVTNPTSMAISPEGRLYVSSRFEGAVYRLNDDGSAEVFASDLGIACGLAFLPDGSLLVGDRSGTIFEVSSGGRTRTLATLPSSVAAFHLALGSDGLYVTAPTLSAHDPVYRVGLDGSVSIVCSAFGRPQGLAFAPDGDLYVVEALAGVSGVYRLPPGGSPQLIVTGPNLVGLAFEPMGDMIACSADTAFRLSGRSSSRG